MKDLNVNRQRRQFLATAGAAVTLIPVAALVGSRAAFAADTPMVDPASAQAMALKYEAVSKADGQMCRNCALYTSATDGAGSCPLFQGAQVSADAWCSAWVLKS